MSISAQNSKISSRCTKFKIFHRDTLQLLPTVTTVAKVKIFKGEKFKVLKTRVIFLFPPEKSPFPQKKVENFSTKKWLKQSKKYLFFKVTHVTTELSKTLNKFLLKKSEKFTVVKNRVFFFVPSQKSAPKKKSRILALKSD